MDDADRRVIVRWNDAGFGEPVAGAAVARSGYGGIVLGPHASPQFDPQPLPRKSRFPDLPADAACTSGASDRRIFIPRRHRLTVAVSNETDYTMDLAAHDHVIAAAIASWA